MTDTLTLIFHEDSTVTIDYFSTQADRITNTPFKYLGTSYPLVYKYYNNNNELIYYIVSITEKNSGLTFTIYESNKNSNSNLTPFEVEFSQLNSLSSINENEFIASIINTNGDCDVIKCTLIDYSCDSLNSAFLSLCSNDDDILNVYYQPEINKYIYLHYSSGQMTSGIVNSSGDDDYKESTKIITLNEDCNSISQLQTIQITENVILNCFMNTGNKKVYCSKGEYNKEKEEYNLNEFTTDLTCPSESFSIDKLANNYIIISCPGGEREQPHYILYDSNKNIKGQGQLYANDPQSSRGPHYMRDFTITPSGDIYILANHPPIPGVNCDYFHQHKITKSSYMCSDYSQVIIPKDDQSTKLNTYINNNNNNIPSKIVVYENNCNDVLMDSNNGEIPSNINFDNINVKQKYNIDCTLTYYSGLGESGNYAALHFILLCDINLSSCDSHCKECELSSVSSILMNCNECSSDNYIYKENPEENIDSGNCCEEVSNCQIYYFNCTCDKCKNGYEISNTVCKIVVEDKIIEMVLENAEFIDFAISDQNAHYIKITKDNDFQGQISVYNNDEYVAQNFMILKII